MIKNNTIQDLASTIEIAFAEANPAPHKEAINQAIKLLETGEIRVAHKTKTGWITNQWVKQAILLYFKLNASSMIQNGEFKYFDKIGLKYANYTQAQFVADGVRVVPPAIAREGVYVGSNSILISCYVNIGAYIDSGTMIDIFATIGSCAQIGKNCHISSNTCIGGVLEPMQNNPTIIEDNCFVGAGCSIVEGAIIEENSIIAMGVRIGQSTKIYDRINDQVLYGKVPAGSVVVPGSMPSDNGKYNLDCAVIIKHVDMETRVKVGINQILREATAIA